MEQYLVLPLSMQTRLDVAKKYNILLKPRSHYYENKSIGHDVFTIRLRKNKQVQNDIFARCCMCNNNRQKWFKYYECYNFKKTRAYTLCNYCLHLARRIQTNEYKEKNDIYIYRLDGNLNNIAAIICIDGIILIDEFTICDKNMLNRYLTSHRIMTLLDKRNLMIQYGHRMKNILINDEYDDIISKYVLYLLEMMFLLRNLLCDDIITRIFGLFIDIYL